MRVQYRIGEFAELGGVSAKTLGHYHKVGFGRRQLELPDGDN